VYQMCHGSIQVTHIILFCYSRCSYAHQWYQAVLLHVSNAVNEW
jgi:hypothetical protein